MDHDKGWKGFAWRCLLHDCMCMCICMAWMDVLWLLICFLVLAYEQSISAF
jgi:hypothetical protein